MIVMQNMVTKVTIETQHSEHLTHIKYSRNEKSYVTHH